MKRREFFKRLGSYSAVVGALPVLGLAASACGDEESYDDYGDHDPCDRDYDDSYDDCWDYQEAYEDVYYDSSDYVDGTAPNHYADYFNAS